MAVDVVIGFDSLAVVFAVGLLITDRFLVPAAGFQTADLDNVRRLFSRLLAACLAALWLTSLAWLWLRTASMSGRPILEALSAIPLVLSRTHYGSVWWLRAAAVLASSIVLLAAYRKRGLSSWPVMALLMFGMVWIAASRTASGHAAANGDWTLREVMDWLHWLSVSTWGGSIMGTLCLVFPRLRQASVTNQACFARRFSLMATWALAGVLITGIYSAWHMLPAVSAFWSSYYGRLLGVKLLFVAGMAALGALNHYRLVPAMQADAGSGRMVAARRLRMSVLCEAVLLLVVLAVTAVLLGSMPPHG